MFWSSHDVFCVLGFQLLMIYEGHSAIASYHIFGVIFQHQCCLIVFFLASLSQNLVCVAFQAWLLCDTFRLLAHSFSHLATGLFCEFIWNTLLHKWSYVKPAEAWLGYVVQYLHAGQVSHPFNVSIGNVLFFLYHSIIWQHASAIVQVRNVPHP
jgi:hypothetical protein